MRCLWAAVVAGALGCWLAGPASVSAGLPEVERGFQQGRYDEALRELNTLAVAGDGLAQRRLGDLLLRGLAFHDRVVAARDPCAAAVWYGRAAAQGEPGAMLRLGLLYADGVGVRRNLVQAYGLIGMATAKGEPEAAAPLAALAKRMTRRQLEKGARLVREAQAGW